VQAVIDSGLVGSLWEGYHESRRCSRTPTQSHISPNILVYEETRDRDSHEVLRVQAESDVCRLQGIPEMCSGCSYLRLTDSCITQLKAQGTSKTCNESKEEEEEASK